MSKKKVKTFRPKARVPKGLRDIPAREIRAMARMMRVIEQVYDSYGFEPLETPAFEYTDALGKFSPIWTVPMKACFPSRTRTINGCPCATI